MIVMVEASTHTIARLWKYARALESGDVLDQEKSAGVKQVLRELGVNEPTPEPQEMCQ